MPPGMVTLAFALLLSSFACPPRALATPKELLKQGMQEYQAGDYANAAGHLGAALTTEFNNPVLHYFLANSYIKLNDKKSAIREFRIAYALDPEGEVGKFSKQALSYLGIDADVPEKKEAPVSYEKKVDPRLEKTLQTLDKQAYGEADSRSNKSRITSEQIERKNSEALQNKRNDFISKLPPWYLHRNNNQLPSDISRQLEELRRDFETRKSTYLDSSMREATEIRKSADNLRDLLNEKPKPGKTHLDPVGTNLYTRNYRHEKKTETQTDKQSVTSTPSK